MRISVIVTRDRADVKRGFPAPGSSLVINSTLRGGRQGWQTSLT